MKKSWKRFLPMLLAGISGFVFSVCDSGGTSGQCTGGTDCATPSCTDKVQNGGETDIDCGGSCSTKCGAQAKCQNGTDCQSGLVCPAGVCIAPTCTDGILDGSETDKDCGGACMKCAPNAACKVAADCTSANCASGVCAAPSCTDGIKNGDESDVDCGGSCNACAVGKTCVADKDCGIFTCGSPVPEGQTPVCGLGNGADGDLAIPSGMTRTINTAATSGTGTMGGTTMTVRDGSPFLVDQVVLIHQTQGTGAGQHEMNRIATVSGTQLTFKNPLKYDYVTGAQVVAVPQYNSVNVTAGGFLTAPAWDGQKGGILVFLSRGDVAAGGTITMASKGFRGAGVTGVCFPSAPGCTLNHGRTGESSLGASAFSTLNGQAQGMNNGGGGGGGSRGQDCAAGGGGSYGTAGTNGVDGTIGACIVVGGQHRGGLAGTAVGGQDLFQSIFLGSAGGEGGPDEDGAYPGPGGNGGGIVMWNSKSVTLDGTASITVSGANGGNGSNSGPCGGGGGGMGNGGGGSGGAVRIQTADSATLNTGKIVASAGAGGNAGSCGATYPGGNGGLGRIHIRALGTISGTTTPPAFTN